MKHIIWCELQTRIGFNETAEIRIPMQHFEHLFLSIPSFIHLVLIGLGFGVDLPADLDEFFLGSG